MYEPQLSAGGRKVGLVHGIRPLHVLLACCLVMVLGAGVVGVTNVDIWVGRVDTNVTLQAK